jgi:hypothetical protein
VGDAGLKEQLVSAGSPEQERLKFPENPAMPEVETNTLTAPPCTTLTDGVAASVKSGLAMVESELAMVTVNGMELLELMELKFASPE